MSESAASARYTIAANLRWFAGTYALVALALVGASMALAAYNIEVPQAANIGVFIGLVMIAGNRFAEKNGDWNSKIRGQLALGYLVTAISVSVLLALVFAGVLIVIEPARLRQAAIMLKAAFPFFAVSAAITVVAYYLGALLILGFAARQRDRGAWQNK